MILNAEERSEDWFRDRVFDVCVIGAGPAGITLSRKLGAAGASVGLFEAGGLEFTQASQELYQGDVAGAPEYYPLDGARLRFFGGSSNHWGGWTAPIAPYEFTAMAHHPLSGWPIVKKDLDPYREEADDILDLPRGRPPADPLNSFGVNIVPRLFRFSRPVTRFGEKYRAEIETSPNIRTYLNANLVDVRLDDARKAVIEAVFRSYENPETFSVRARFFVLCLGGIENARALLNADGQVVGGIGNEFDVVGRYFMEHPHAPAGRAVMREPLTRLVVYSPTPLLMERNAILSFGVRVGQFDEWNAIDFTGDFAPQPPCAVEFDSLLKVEMAGEAPQCPAHVGDVFIACEQSLEPENRVSLMDERDRFGLRKARLDWTMSEMDIRTLKIGVAEIAGQFALNDIGRIRIADWLVDDALPDASQLFGGNHHMGTTRMSADPKTGVVDADTRLHALENLYVGGSSVFTTASHVNPTYTIVQLALRQADHLRKRLEMR